MIDVNEDNDAVSMFAKNLAKSDTVLSRYKKIRENSAILRLDAKSMVQFTENLFIQPDENKNMVMSANVRG